MSTSIRRRLLLWLTPILLLTGLGAVVLTRFNVQTEIDELFDKELRDMAYSLQDKLGAFQDAASEPDRLAERSDLDLISQAWGPDGQLLYRSHRFPPLPYRDNEGWSTVDWRGEPWRVFSLKTPAGLIQIAQSLHERKETASEITTELLIPLLALVPGLPLLIWFGIGRGLLPLQDLSRIVDQRSPDSLHPISDRRLPDEVGTLVAALNGLLKRLEVALATQREFTADAAHELRSPLTALSLQAQVAEGAPNPEKKAAALKTLRSGITRTTHLVEQLLTLARVDPESIEHRSTPQRLDELARTVVAEYIPLADEKKIDLGIAASEPALVCGDREAFRILIANLVDNAVRYTRVGGRINLSIVAFGNSIRLDVDDTGPGISLEERARVFDRFYRALGNMEPGSGLGLSIVKRIADRHGIVVQLSDGESGRGLQVSLYFPLYRV